MSDIYFSCLGCNALYNDMSEIEAHLLLDPCHNDDNQALYDTYGTAEYLHIMLSKIQMLISQSAEEADTIREESVTGWEGEERQWEERQWEERKWEEEDASIQDGENSGPHEDHDNSITIVIDDSDFILHTLDCVNPGMDCGCPIANGAQISYPPSPEMGY